jgi:hypothetical protein
MNIESPGHLGAVTLEAKSQILQQIPEEQEEGKVLMPKSCLQYVQKNRKPDFTRAVLQRLQKDSVR